VRPEKVRGVDAIVDRIVSNRSRYEAVERATGVPWHVTAALHNMECGGSFLRHLHEGSPLTGRTRYVPKGRPKDGVPPFAWEVSAVDALRYDRMVAVQWNSIARALQACEAYNGTGYQRFHPEVPTPYLWSGTNLYVRGKYVADGKWSSTAVSAQVGVAAIWKRMEGRKILKGSSTADGRR
jgi:lysozyme family protein